MKAGSRKKVYLGMALVSVMLLGLALFGILTLQQNRSNRSLSKVAKPVIKMDLLAPPDHGWISDHEIFFLREKNQGDFMCIKADIRDGKETVLEALSPFLRDKEDRSVPFEMQSSPSGKRIGMLFGAKADREIYIHDIEALETISVENKEVPFFGETWLPDESGWVLWQPQFAPELGDAHFKLIPTLLSSQTNHTVTTEIVMPKITTPDLFLDSRTMLVTLITDIGALID